MGIFVVDTGGGPRAFAGPVARAFEVHQPLAIRLTDESAATLARVDDPWAMSYTVPAAGAAPRFMHVHYDLETGTVIVSSDVDLGAATVKLLDHHRVALETKHATIERGETKIGFKKPRGIGAVFVELGGFRDWAVTDGYGEIDRTWGKSLLEDRQDE